jgi:predicted NUDIX family NTP pyrophosphohydrolase
MKTSAGLLVYRSRESRLEVLITHPGGPFFAKKDNGVWSLPKGEIDNDSDALAAAKREFNEETGFEAPGGAYISLGEVAYPKSGKTIIAWAVEGDFDTDELVSNKFELEWPPRSGKKQQFPEVDRGGWFTLDEAAKKLFAPNLPFLKKLADELGVEFNPDNPDTPKQNSLF